ncbi:MAG: insulinase family protein [Xanthomonadales bacterium]|nr:insulinase family protein [Gammaproteobacteria bacterium]NNE05005.1 insulinase family protein [Xanthomonadales bacterium]NNL94553.1 insulinase family protein [Xanthomonadales bacterium]
MNQFLMAAAGLLLLLPGQAFADSDKILPYPIYQHRLDNGLNVVTVPFDSPGLASFYIVTRVGARNEVEEGVTGFAHFFEHMMFRGTDQYSKAEYAAALKSTGAAANANTSQDRTEYHMTGNAEKLELMFELEADRFQNLNYSEHDFKTEAGAVKGEYTKNFASPYSRINEKLLETAFTTHTYGHTTMGYFDDIVDMPNQFEYSKKFFDRYYRPEYNTILVVGDVTPEQVNALAEKYFGDWQRGSYESVVPVEPGQTETRFVHLQDGSIPPYFSLSYKGPAFSDEEIDMPALDVLSSIVFSPTSDLYKKLVLEEQKVRFIGGGAFDSRDPNLFTIQVSMVDKADIGYVRGEIEKAIEKLQQDGVDEAQLQRTKSYLKNNFAMAMDTPDAIAGSLSHYIQLTGDPESINRLYRLYDQVSQADIRAMAQKYFQSQRMTIATITEDQKGPFE